VGQLRPQPRREGEEVIVDATDAGGTPVPEPDDALLRRLGAMLNSVDPVPEDVLVAARAAFRMARLDAELAELSYDSLVTQSPVSDPRAREPELVLRSDQGPRLLTFEAADLRVEVQVEDAGDGARLLGQLEPRGPGLVEIRDLTGRSLVEAEVDQAGRFVVERIPSGAVSLVCRRTDARPTATEWTTLA
jgi:hypothetical protein